MPRFTAFPVAMLAAAASVTASAGCGCGDLSAGDPDDGAVDDLSVEDVAFDEDAQDDTPDVPADTAPDSPADTAGDPDVPIDTSTDPDAVEDWAVDEAEEDIAGDEPAGPPAGCVEGTFQPFFGNFHAHTSNSDGEGSPADAFAYARDVAHLDMMVVTDHLEQLYIPFGRWDTCLSEADDAYAPGTYLAACGYEYGSGFILPWFQSTGHNNVFFEDSLFPEIQLDFHDFYDSVVACTACVASFNHPGDDPTMTWSDFEYFPAVDQKMNLFEFNTPADAWALYFQALHMGWHVSPTLNQDNHSANWGTANDERTGYWMTDLTRESLHAAMQDGRSFMTEDRNASIRMMGWSVCWMGTTAAGTWDMPVDVEAHDADAGDGIDLIEIFGPGPSLVGSFDCSDSESCSAHFDVAATGPTYVVARATETDGARMIAAPIWLIP